MMEKPRYIYFIGIGGIGMSGLARYFHRAGCSVAGYDRTPSDLTAALVQEGIPVQFTEEEKDVPAPFRDAPAQDVLVVRTPAVPAESPLLAYWQQRGVRMLKRSEVLGMVTRDKPTIAVAGTHGKTTVTTMVAHLLTASGVPCNAFMGGISGNYGTNVLLNDAAVVNVVEADEYDRSFLQLHPATAIITSMDPDHLDIYGTPEAMVEAYQAFAQQVAGRVLVNERIGALAPAGAVFYGIEGASVPRAENVHVADGRYRFDLVWSAGAIRDLELGMPGRHNVENAVAASAVALAQGVTPEALRAALASFRGVARRFEVRARNARSVLIDDYAHHPAELEACINSVRELYPGRHVTGIFQPHLFSRTKDLAAGFARALALVDSLVLLPIYPARELPMPGITSDWLLEKVAATNKVVCTKEELVPFLRTQNVDILLALGAGDIDRCIPALVDLIENP